MALKMILVKTSLNSDGFPRIGGNFLELGGQFDLDPFALGLIFPPGLRHHNHFPNQIIDRDRREFLISADARKFLDPADRLGAILRRTFDGLQPFTNLFRAEMIELIGKELDVAQNDGKEIIEIVGHAARHLSQGLEFLGLNDLILGLLQLAEGLLQIGKELGVLDGDTHLAGEGGEDLEVILIKSPEIMAFDIQNPDHLLPHLKRKGRFRLDLRGSGEIVGIFRYVRSIIGFARLGNPSHDSVDADPKPQMLDRLKIPAASPV